MQQAVTTAEPESDVKTEEHTVKDCSQQLIDEDDKKREGEKKQEGNGQVGDQSKGEKPVPAMRRKKKNGLVAAEGGLLEKDSKEEHASEHAQGNMLIIPPVYLPVYEVYRGYIVLRWLDVKTS